MGKKYTKFKKLGPFKYEGICPECEKHGTHVFDSFFQKGSFDLIKRVKELWKAGFIGIQLGAEALLRPRSAIIRQIQSNALASIVFCEHCSAPLEVCTKCKAAFKLPNSIKESKCPNSNCGAKSI